MEAVSRLRAEIMNSDRQHPDQDLAAKITDPPQEEPAMHRNCSSDAVAQ
jgi:hypothetical protein